MSFTLLGGKLTMNGAAPAEDALWLAASAEIKPGMRVLDAAAGSGVVGLAVLVRCLEVVVTGVEIQPELATQAEANATLNGFKNYTCMAEDILQFKPAHKFDAVVCNPPFYAAERGHQSENAVRQLARHQPTDMLETWVKQLLTLTTGPVYLVLHSASQVELKALAKALKVVADITPLATHVTRPPKRLLARLVAGDFIWTEHPPLNAYGASQRVAILERGEAITAA